VQDRQPLTLNQIPQEGRHHREAGSPRWPLSVKHQPPIGMTLGDKRTGSSAWNAGLPPAPPLPRQPDSSPWVGKELPDFIQTG
jgi:hypothetical protein